MPSSKRVLVLDIGEAAYTLTAARSLGRAGHEVHFGFPVGSPQREANSRYRAGSVVYPSPSLAPDDFVAVMRDRAASFDVIFPGKEPSLIALARARRELEARGPTIPVPPFETIERATQKLPILEAARTLGLRLPRTLIAASLPSPEEVVGAVGTPFVIKASSEIGLLPIERHFVVDHAEDPTLAPRFEALAAHGPVILQEYVPGRGAGIAMLFSRSRREVAYSGHRRIFEQFSDGGPSLLAETHVDPDALQQSRRLLASLGWEGIAMVEFRTAPTGENVFMEVNPRFWGTLSLAIASGVDFPALMVDRFRDLDPGPPVGPNRRRRYFSIEASVTAAASPAEKRPSLGLLALELSRSAVGLSVREFQGTDLGPSLNELFYVLRSRAQRGTPARVGDLWIGPFLPYDRLRDRGVRTVFDLREAREVAQRESAVPSTMTRISFPIPDDAGLGTADFSDLVHQIDVARSAGGVYVHCRLGQGRAPMVAAGYLVAHGISAESAFRELYAARPTANLKENQREAVYRLASQPGTGPKKPTEAQR